jgi:hypothetical protein
MGQSAALYLLDHLSENNSLTSLGMNLYLNQLEGMSFTQIANCLSKLKNVEKIKMNIGRNGIAIDNLAWALETIDKGCTSLSSFQLSSQWNLMSQAQIKREVDPKGYSFDFKVKV